jgi:hypothetical protein
MYHFFVLLSFAFQQNAGSQKSQYQINGHIIYSSRPQMGFISKVLGKERKKETKEERKKRGRVGGRREGREGRGKEGRKEN